jgi:MGT family glycosyltransferase
MDDSAGNFVGGLDMSTPAYEAVPARSPVPILPCEEDTLAALHIAICNIPALGHVNPTLPLAAELVARGHRVSYATADRRAPEIEATGATLVPYRTTRPAESDPSMVLPDRETYLAHTMVNFIEEAAHTLPQLDAALAADPPDVVLYDRLSFAGRIYAIRHGLPSVRMWPMLISGEHWSLFRTAPFDEDHPLMVSYREKLADLLRWYRVDVSVADFLDDPVPDADIAFFPRSFQYHGELFGDRYSFVGPCRQAPDGAPVRSVALVSLGSVYNNQPEFYRSCVAALAGSPWHVVLAVGERIDPAALAPLPDNVEAHAVVPQTEVLAGSAVFVCHAGMGGLMEAMQAGVPVVTVPQTVEQESNAVRVEQLGLGVRLDPAGLTPQALRAAIDRAATDPGIAAHVAQLRRDIAEAGGAVRAADVVEALPAARRTAAEARVALA